MIRVMLYDFLHLFPGGIRIKIRKFLSYFFLPLGVIYRADIKRREKASIFNYSLLSRNVIWPIHKYRYVMSLDEVSYGIGNSIRKYCDIGDQGQFIAEHGFYFHNYPHIKNDLLLRQKKIKILAMSRYRYESLKQQGYEACMIGNYFNYVDSLFSSEATNKIKQQLGRTVLIIPAHSCCDALARYPVEQIIAYVNNKYKEYDTKLACLYWQDIQENLYNKYYIDGGINIVTAGHVFDINFLRRLKTIFTLADVVVISTVGTHVGYLLQMNKKIDYFEIRNDFKLNPNPIRDDNLLSSDMDLIDKLQNDMIRGLTKEPLDITLLDYYYGFNTKYSPKELRNILLK